VLLQVEDEEGGDLGKDKLPSSSACKAFNEEEDEDEFDRLACESLQKLRCRPKPALKTQVRLTMDFGSSKHEKLFSRSRNTVNDNTLCSSLANRR
jgi:hypothetical protein